MKTIVQSLILLMITTGLQAQEVMEEITVVAPKSTNSLKIAMDRAQDETYLLFNELIEDPNFHITCRKERPFKDGFDPIPVHRAVRVCLTDFVYRERTQANQDFMNGYSDGEIVGLSSHQQELEQKMKGLITSDPSFRAAMTKYVYLKQEYDKAREEDRNSGFLSRLFQSDD